MPIATFPLDIANLLDESPAIRWLLQNIFLRENLTHLQLILIYVRSSSSHNRKK